MIPGLPLIACSWTKVYTPYHAPGRHSSTVVNRRVGELMQDSSRQVRCGFVWSPINLGGSLLLTSVLFADGCQWEDQLHAHDKVTQPFTTSEQLAVSTSISFHSPQIKPAPLISLTHSSSQSWKNNWEGGCICFYCLFIILNGKSSFCDCFQPGRPCRYAAGVSLQLLEFLMDLPCRFWEVSYITVVMLEITPSMHTVWKDEWQEKHEALGKEVVDILNICAALKCHRSWPELQAAFPEMLDSSLHTGKWESMSKTSSLLLKAHGALDVHRLFCCCHSGVSRREAADKQKQQPGAVMHYRVGTV